jgi:hypothetical protein
MNATKTRAAAMPIPTDPPTETTSETRLTLDQTANLGLNERYWL